MARKRLGQYPWVGPGLAIFAGFSFIFTFDVLAGILAPKTRLESVLSVLCEHPRLLWTQCPHLDADFFGTRVRTGHFGLRDEPSERGNRPRVLTLGASPTFGWGVRGEETYSALLGRSLGGADVFNGGQIGYSSYQGLRFLREFGDRIRPDIITVSYVINDVDSYRFFRSDGLADKSLSDADALGVWMRNAARRSFFLRWAGRIFSGAPPEPGEMRVSREDYKSNLRAIADWSEGRARVVFLKMPVNLPKGAPAADAVEGARLYQEGMTFYEKNDCVAAEEKLYRAVRADGGLSRAYYYLGVCAHRFGRKEAASAMFQAVKRAESERSARAAEEYNAAMEEVARERNIPVVDVVRAFSKRKEYLFVDPKSDTIHPNALGHEIIAREVGAVIRPLIGL